jgi:Raf kinase inhibitor-like YbhB/YbcL family protein
MFCHWVLYDLAPTATELKSGVPKGATIAVGQDTPARQAENDFGAVGYGGPCPPSGTHHYVFRLIALDVAPGALPGDDRAALFRSMEEHRVAEGRLIGTFSH